jgi:cytochrome P450
VDTTSLNFGKLADRRDDFAISLATHLLSERATSTDCRFAVVLSMENDITHGRRRCKSHEEEMTIGPRAIPPGPAEEYRRTQDLLHWMSDQFERFGSIYKTSIYGSSVYVISDPDYARHVLVRNWQNYEKGQAINRVAFLLGGGLMVSEGEFWKHQRRMIQPAFHYGATRTLNNVITTVNDALLERWQQAAQKRARVNVTHDLSRMILEVGLKSIFGDDYEQVGPHFNILSEVTARNLKFAQAFRSLGKIVLQIAAQRRKDGATSTDILGMLMRAADRQTGQVMTDGQLVNEIMTLIVAGHETTASTLNWIWYLISQHPEVEAKLSNELDRLGNEPPSVDDLTTFSYTRQIIDESLRLYPAGWLMTRRARNDDRLGDYFVPAGTEIYISPYFIHRRPDLWEDPHCFNPDRFSSDDAGDRSRKAMLAFSAGPRNCIGEHLARNEMQIHLMIVAKRLRLRYVQTRQLELDAGVNLRSKHDFIMTPELKTTANQ